MWQYQRNSRKIKFTGRNDSNGVLTMPASVIVPEKLLDKKWCEEEDEAEEKHEFWGIFGILLKQEIIGSCINI